MGVYYSLGAQMVNPVGELLRSRKSGAIILKYVFFAGISIGANLAFQWLTGKIYRGPWRIWAMLIVGTGVGLLVKYALDKRFIFFYKVETKARDLKTFVFYVAMGIVTTAMFWGTELIFNALLDEAAAKYLGGAIGLTAGYITKYFLDRKWVFKK